ncbi:MAG: phage holin [Candidatus Brocadia sp. WS118]|nr:MAG: phage holin [Candidatus Brocadia sp. WS118]
MSLKKYIQNKWHDLMRFLRKATLTFLSALAADIEKSGGEFLMETALDAVKIAEQLGGSGSSKFEAAYNYIEKQLKTEGIEIIRHAVNGAIEAAVAQMKAK